MLLCFFMYTHIHIYTHTPLLKDKKSWPCFITFLSQTKIPLPKNKQKKWIFIFFRIVIYAALSSVWCQLQN